MAADSFSDMLLLALPNRLPIRPVLWVQESQDLHPASNRETDEWWHLLDGAEAVLPVDLAGYYKRTG